MLWYSLSSGLFSSTCNYISKFCPFSLTYSPCVLEILVFYLPMLSRCIIPLHWFLSATLYILSLSITSFLFSTGTNIDHPRLFFSSQTRASQLMGPLPLSSLIYMYMYVLLRVFHHHHLPTLKVCSSSFV